MICTVLVVIQPKLFTVIVYVPTFAAEKLMIEALPPTPVQPDGPAQVILPGPPVPLKVAVPFAHGGGVAEAVAVGIAFTTTKDCVDDTQPAELIVCTTV